MGPPADGHILQSSPESMSSVFFVCFSAGKLFNVFRGDEHELSIYKYMSVHTL